MDGNLVLESAWRAYSENDYEKMASLGSQLVAAGDPWVVQGHFLRGMAHEHWLGGPGDHLRLALDDYRIAAVLAPHANAFQNMARVLMKLGEAHYEEAYRFLQEGWSLARTPELMLGFGEYFRSKPQPDFNKAMSFYRRAAMHGRFRGFLAAAELCRSNGQPLRGLLWDVLRVISAPVVWLTQGRSAAFEF